VFPSDLPGVNPAILNGVLLYYRLMTKWSGLCDSTELSRVGLSLWVSVHVSWRTLYAMVHVLKLSNTVHTTPIPPTNNDHAQLYFLFVFSFQIEPKCVCLFPFIHTKPSFPHSFLHSFLKEREIDWRD
jgi:hypothetical protein